MSFKNSSAFGFFCIPLKLLEAFECDTLFRLSRQWIAKLTQQDWPSKQTMVGCNRNEHEPYDGSAKFTVTVPQSIYFESNDEVKVLRKWVWLIQVPRIYLRKYAWDKRKIYDDTVALKIILGYGLCWMAKGDFSVKTRVDLSVVSTFVQCQHIHRVIAKKIAFPPLWHGFTFRVFSPKITGSIETKSNRWFNCATVFPYYQSLDDLSWPEVLAIM